MHPVIIIGSGYAGYAVARDFRRRNKETPILLLTADGGEFYSKPALSEAFSEGQTAADLVGKSAAQMAEQIKGEIRTHTRVTAIDPAAQTVSVGDERLPYSQLVLALGADPIALPATRGFESHVFVVNDLDDYARFSAALAGKKHVTVLGAGLIGCEYADHLRQAGYEIDVIDLAAWPLSRLLTPENGQYFQEKLGQTGIRWHMNTGLTGLEAAGDQVKVTCDNGESWTADLVLSAVGLRPRTALAATAGINVNRGIVADRSLRTNYPNIYAIGDCAEVAGHLLPYIMPISLSARVVGANLNGESAEVAYPSMPVIAKTPTCPTTVCPPVVEGGAWTTETTDVGVKSLYQSEDGMTSGFILLGADAAQGAALARQLPPLMA